MSYEPPLIFRMASEPGTTEAVAPFSVAERSSLASAFNVWKHTVTDGEPQSPLDNQIACIAEMAFFGGASVIIGTILRGALTADVLARFQQECEQKIAELRDQ
jgi:hypothetical protein